MKVVRGTRTLFLNVLILSALVAGAIASIQATYKAFAAAYEWIPHFHGKQIHPDGFLSDNWNSSKGNLDSNASTTLQWNVTTTQAFTEYRSVYYYVTSSNTFSPARDWAVWTEHTNCRKSSSVLSPPGVIDNCAVTTTNTSVTTTIWYRATTQWSGCGTWTPTPTLGCGDYRQASSTLRP